jgi:hypothetical protein
VGVVGIDKAIQYLNETGTYLVNLDTDIDMDAQDEKMDSQLAWMLGITIFSFQAIRDYDDTNEYEPRQWAMDLTEKRLCIVPTQIHIVEEGSARFPRFWGYLVQFIPELESIQVDMVTMPLPYGLACLIGAQDPDFPGFTANPLTDREILMIVTTYHGLQKFTKGSELRRMHIFQETSLVTGFRDNMEL